MEKAVGYIRVSGLHKNKHTDEIDYNSIEGQRREVERFAKQTGFDLINIYEDPGISGAAIENRPELLRLLSDSESGKFGVVIFPALDRLCREGQDGMKLRKLLSARNIKLFAIRDGINNPQTDGEIFNWNLKAIMAEDEKNRIKTRTRMGRYNKAIQNIPFL